MPTLSEACAALAGATGIPRGTIEHVGRRLGEAALLPRGPRGVNAPQLDARHLAMLVIGVLHLGDGFAGTIARVPVEVAKVAALAGGRRREGFWLSRHVLIPEECDFLTAVAVVLAGMGDPNPEARRNWRAMVDEVGLMFGGDRAAGFIVLSTGDTNTENRLAITYDAGTDEHRKVWHAPFRRQVQLSGPALAALGGLLAAGDGEEDDDGDRTVAGPPPPAQTEQQQQEQTAWQRQT